MHILIATDGHIDADATAVMVARIKQDDDKVTVLTVVNHPGEFLRNFAEVGGIADVDRILSESSASKAGFGSGTVSADRVDQVSKTKDSGGPPLDQYFTDTAQRHQKPLLESLSSNGVEAKAVWAPTENKTARTILDTAGREKADLLVIGSHGGGRFEGLLGSTVTKVVRHADLPVMLVKSRPGDTWEQH